MGCDCSTQWICCCAFQPKQITAQTAIWGRNIQRRTKANTDKPRVKLVGSFVASFVSDPVLICPVCPPSKRKIWKTYNTVSKEDPEWYPTNTWVVLWCRTVIILSLTTSPRARALLLKLINHRSWFEGLYVFSSLLLFPACSVRMDRLLTLQMRM